jgi:DNA-directed RNA polymerase specialized sigma24 family protein
VKELNPEAFWRLMGRLDSDPERAGEKYESLRHRLVVFFEGRGCGQDCDALADRALDTVAAKFLDDIQIYSSSNIFSYAYGVARYVWKDWLKERKPEPLTVDPPAPQSSEPAVFRLACLDRCLAELAPESRSLILEYYQGVGGDKIANRSRIAGFLRISPNALRRRAHWIRVRQLEPCLKKCGEEGFQ